MSTAVTPTKVSTISVISPTSQNHVCIVCGSSVSKSGNRRRLYRDGKKTPYCEELEYVIGESLDPFLQTHISCRSCRDKAATLMKNLEHFRKQFHTTKCVTGRKEQVVKRIVPCYSQRARKRVLFDSASTRDTMTSHVSRAEGPCQSISFVLLACVNIRAYRC